MNVLTTKLLEEIHDTGPEIGSAIMREGQESETIKVFAYKLRILLTERLPNTSTRLRSLFAADSDVPVLYTALLRVALRQVQWKKLARALNEAYNLGVEDEPA